MSKFVLFMFNTSNFIGILPDVLYLCTLVSWRSLTSVEDLAWPRLNNNPISKIFHASCSIIFDRDFRLYIFLNIAIKKEKINKGAGYVSLKKRSSEKILFTVDGVENNTFSVPCST